MRPVVKRKDREAIYAEFQNTCVACGLHCPHTRDNKVYYGIAQVMRKGVITPKHVLLTIDHFVPVCLGGKYRRENYIPLCEMCNNKKGNQDPLTWALSLGHST